MRYKVRWIWEYDIEETGNPEQYDFDSLDEVLHRSKLEFPNSSIRLAREAFRPNGGYCKSAPQHTYIMEVDVEPFTSKEYEILPMESVCWSNCLSK
ncbi:hypothetical protein LINPERPRIM_LOCUS16601 [Linum perenne]